MVLKAYKSIMLRKFYVLPHITVNAINNKINTLDG